MHHVTVNVLNIQTVVAQLTQANAAVYCDVTSKSLSVIQDLIIPILKHPAEFVNASPLLGHPPRERDILCLFKGDVGKTRLRHYSRGIRQKLYTLARVH